MTDNHQKQLGKILWDNVEQLRGAMNAEKFDKQIAFQCERRSALCAHKKALMQQLFPSLEDHPAPSGHPSRGGESGGMGENSPPLEGWTAKLDGVVECAQPKAGNETERTMTDDDQNRAKGSVLIAVSRFPEGREHAHHDAPYLLQPGVSAGGWRFRFDSLGWQADDFMPTGRLNRTQVRADLGKIAAEPLCVFHSMFSNFFNNGVFHVSASRSSSGQQTSGHR